MNLSKVKIKEAMESQGIKTFTELAERLGITKNQLSVMMSENYNPLKARVEQLCQLLEVRADSIMDFDAPLSENATVSLDCGEVTAIELFAGAGGLALGLEQAGIKTVEYIEFDKACCETLKANRPNWNVVCDDIHNVDFTQYEGKIDIVTGGFPCQAFSFAGKKLGFEDTRGTLFHEFARCVKEVRPKMFLAENVRGLVFHDNGRTLSTIISVLESLGYHTQQKIMNACYYGVGQKRERIVIIGIRDDLDINFDYPIADEKWTTLRDALKDCPKSIGESYSEKKRKVLDLVPAGGCWVDLPEEVAKEYMGKSYYSGGGRRGMARRISWDEPSLTLTCSPSQKQTERCHPDETRPFTVREYARIQSFPDDWTFSGGITDQYKQIGNAVPVEMARRVGVELKNSILNYRASEE
ncbi:MAG: DNA (cytosine-5-)-methyltransferase [Oscillospiraceae bacterium]|nr:DNA (cytosine-5-)-methyltransferase [Oscillospiraceae bacterium]